jgi:hypothetical protein
MYVSRMPFHVAPGKTSEVEQRLLQLKHMIDESGGQRARILRTHFASDGAPDVVLEQEAEDLQALETQIKQVSSRPEFQQWSREMSTLLIRPPKREAYIINDGA